MDLDEYQKQARSTAIYSPTKKANMIYPALGIIGECGEVSEKIKKLIRDDGWNMTEDRKIGIAKELGDCCWYLANICCEANLSLKMMYDMQGYTIYHIVRNLQLPSLVLHMNRHASSLAELLEEWHYKYAGSAQKYNIFGHLMSIHISHIISCIEEIAKRCDFTLEYIYTLNIQKLFARKQKGTLKGDGDDR